MSTVKARVALGVKWLDRNKPDWVERVEIKKLDMASGCNCVLGQVFAQDADAKTQLTGEHLDGYDHVLYRLLPDTVEEETWSERRGFDFQQMPYEEDYAALAAEWTRVIEERRAS